MSKTLAGAVTPPGSDKEMPRMRARFGLVFAAALLTLSACATIRRDEAARTEQLLAAAGFQMQSADSPERIRDLDVMPPLRIVARNHDDKVTYTFADPYKCRCVYVGGRREYTAYRRLARDKQVEEERLLDGEPNDGLWGPLDSQ
jgi:hypothetical protein